jgi:hypothetical protein
VRPYPLRTEESRRCRWQLRDGVSSTIAASTPGTPGFCALWKRYDSVRTEQLARLKGLELQAGDDYGQRAWEQALLLWRQLPEGSRVDLPSPRAFGRVLGLFRTCVTVKSNKLLRLELSAEEIARLVGYSKATVEAVLRWLGCEAIESGGTQVSRGLGILHRGRRTGIALGDGVRRFIYRTSRIVLTVIGRALLGLASRDEERKRERLNESTRKAVAPPECSPPEGESPEVARAALARIHEVLR